MKSVPCFTVLEPSALGVNAFFSMTRRHFVKLRDDPRLASVVRPFHGTPESVLRCTYPMQKYTAKETVEVVRFALSLPKSTQRPTLTPSSMLFLGVGCYPQLDTTMKLVPQTTGGRREHADISYPENR